MPRIKMSLLDMDSFCCWCEEFLELCGMKAPTMLMFWKYQNTWVLLKLNKVFSKVCNIIIILNHFETSVYVCSVALFCRFGTTRLGISSVPWRVTLTRCRTSLLIRLESCWLLALRTWPSNFGTSRALSASGPCMVHISCIYYHIITIFKSTARRTSLNGLWPTTHCSHLQYRLKAYGDPY